MLKLRHPISLLVICLLVMLGVLRSFSPPSPVGADSPDVVFSAIRAEAILRDLLQENRPHVAGSQLNAVVRDRIITHFEAAGYEPEIQSRFQCNPTFGSCSPVENIIAVKQGSDSRHALLVTAHYDSKWAGPGAADDGAATAAILEIARMAADYPPFMNDVIFLISDSEENGLIGARAFADHHPLFEKVRTVINLEARGVTGPSTMFETGEGNRSLIRVFSKNVERPSANSLVYEIYKRMPNNTDYSVYKGEGVMGLNFAFAQGVALYHSVLDDPDHLDLGSLQHHGDNAWAMVNALGDRDLGKLTSKEDAGYIDVFSNTLIHYPVAITGGLALFLGVWGMIAIAAAFHKEFRFRQLRWGLLAIPFLAVAVMLGGYLVSWPLGHWPELHPLEHPYPWTGRIALLLVLAIAGYSTLKIFSGRVSACAWLILAWALVFALAMVLTSKLPTASHIGLIPLVAFALGSVVDIFRKKSPAPLLAASIAGFAAASFISWNHFFLLGAVMNFDRSGVLIIPLLLMVLVAMPMLLAFVRKMDLDWWPVKWLGVALLAVCVVHFFVPGFTAERPRDMALMYSEVEGENSGYIVLESRFRTPDMRYAKKHLFERRELNSGRLGVIERPVREVEPLGLPSIALNSTEAVPVENGWHRELTLDLPVDTPLLALTLPLDSGLVRATVNGETALETSLGTKNPRSRYLLRLINPGAGVVNIGLLTASAKSIPLSAVTWHELPSVLVAPFLGNWPDEAQPCCYGPRAEKIQEFEIR
jgi:hypothetical protein